jgi:hypothetical protein
MTESEAILPMKLTLEIQASNGSTVLAALQAVVEKMQRGDYLETGNVMEDPGFKDSPHRKLLEDIGFKNLPNWRATVKNFECNWE